MVAEKVGKKVIFELIGSAETRLETGETVKELRGIVKEIVEDVLCSPRGGFKFRLKVVEKKK